MARLIGIDGTDFGVLYQTKQDAMGNTLAYTLKHAFLEKYYVNDAGRGIRLVKRLLEKQSIDPDHLKLLVALVRRDVDSIRIPPGSILNVSTSDPDAIIVTVDGKGNPVPLEALLTNSPTERDRLSKLFKYYSAFVYYAYPKMTRELDMYRQVVKYQQQLLNTRDYEVNSLLEANTRIQQVLKNAYATIVNLSAQISMLEQLLQHASMEADGWRKVHEESIKTIQSVVALVNELGDQVARGMTLTMQRHASELSRSQALEDTINTLLSKIKELETDYAMKVAEATKSLRAPATVAPASAPSQSEGGESNASESEA